MTVREALAVGRARLAAAGIENPGLDASLLLAEVLGIGRSSLMARAPDPLGETAAAGFDRLTGRRLAGECVAYILGRKEFYGLEFAVGPPVLVPRPDTETLVEAALGYLRALKQAPDAPPPRVLDLCTGSGAVAVAIKHRMPGAEVWATDISPEALELARANALRLLPHGSVNFCQGDLFDALSGNKHGAGEGGLFSLIAGNPPYVPSGEIPGLSREVRGEPVLALDGGADGLDIIRTIILKAPGFLRPGGALMLETDPRQTGETASLLAEAGFADIRTHRDISGRERVIVGEGFIPAA